jgi:hypothetical protein
MVSASPPCRTLAELFGVVPAAALGFRSRKEWVKEIEREPGAKCG